MQKKRGFTLIELLVVIAIIGILAAIVLVSIRRGPEKAKNAAIISDLAQVRTQAVMIFDDDGSYANLCSSSTSLNTGITELSTLQSDIQDQQGGTLDLACYADANGYCVSAKLLPTTGSDYWCIDATGKPKKTTSHCSSASGCP
ncbi:type II secretion system protein [bacterium]|nr:type II secretion system protein [bacterium]